MGLTRRDARLARNRRLAEAEAVLGFVTILHMGRVVIELPGGEGIIRSDDGEIELTHDVTLDQGQCLQPWDRYQTLRIGLSGERMLFGGLLPAGAVRCEAVEATAVRKDVAVAEGAFAVIFEDGERGEPALGFRDASGRWVHRPMPAEYRHRPVPDAEEPCPVCGHIEYDEYFPTEDWRAGRGMKGTDSFEPSPLVVCRVCGHQEQSGGIYHYGRAGDPIEDEAAREERIARLRAEQAAQRWHANKTTVEAATFPIYAVQGWLTRITGSGSSNGHLTQVTVAHAATMPDPVFVPRPRIEVTTSIDPYRPGELPAARETFKHRVEADANRRPADGLSDAALTLWFRASRRQRVVAACEAPVAEIEIKIDGQPQRFVMVGAADARWVAVRDHHDLTIMITADQIDPASLSIDPVADPKSTLLGPPPQA